MRTLVNRTRGVVIADQVEIAASFWTRARGVIGRRSLPDGFALVIRPCRSIHMAFVAMPLDVIHVGRDGRVVRILHSIGPWRIGPIVWESAWAIELPAGTAANTGTQVGDSVELTATS